MTKWHARWAEDRIGFHQPEINSSLTTHWHRLVPDPTVPVLVPLCGKSRDMNWLHQRGHPVVGVELVEQACRAFFDEQGLPFVVKDVGEHQVFQGIDDAEGIRLMCGDIFAMDAATIGPVGAWFDRAAVVALPPDIHAGYAEHIKGLLTAEAPGLMLTFQYPQDARTDVPYSVGVSDVERSFGDWFDLEVLEVMDLTEGNRWNFPWVHKPVISLRRTG